MRYAVLPILLAAALLSGCATVVAVEGTYDQVWNATVDALTETSGKAPTNRDRELGVIEVEPTDAAVRGSRYGAVLFRAEINPVGGEEIERREVSLYAFEVGTVDQAESRRRDLESFVASRIKGRVGIAEDPFEGMGDAGGPLEAESAAEGTPPSQAE